MADAAYGERSILSLGPVASNLRRRRDRFRSRQGCEVFARRRGAQCSSHQSIQARSGYSAAAALGHTIGLLDGQFESLPVQIEDLSFVRKIWYWRLEARFPWLDPPLLGGPLSLVVCDGRCGDTRAGLGNPLPETPQAAMANVARILRKLRLRSPRHPRPLPGMRNNPAEKASDFKMSQRVSCMRDIIIAIDDGCLPDDFLFAGLGFGGIGA